VEAEGDGERDWGGVVVKSCSSEAAASSERSGSDLDSRSGAAIVDR
jgi:hypothetical protein